MFWLFIVCTAILIAGILGARYHYRRVKSWKSCPSTEEYMECLLIGWSSWMIIVLVSPFSAITLITLIMNLIR